MHENALRACLLALLIGIVVGLRTMTALALVSWASRLGWLPVRGTWLAFLGYAWTPWIVTLFALGEFIADMRPSTPSRTAPFPFGSRILIGALCGAATGTAGGVMIGGIVAGSAGALIGTLGGHAFRARLAAAFGRDRPAAFIEDAIAIAGALLIAFALR